MPFGTLTAHQQFEERAIHLPDSFKAFQGFNDYKKNRKCKPRMNVAELSQHSEALAGLLMFPSLSFVLYFQVVFILKILSGQSPFD